MKFGFMNSVSRTFHQAGFQVKKHSPEILVITGVIGVVTSAVLACKATLKVNEVLEPAKENMDKIHEATEKGVTAAGEEYSQKDAQSDTLAVYMQTGVKLVKLYAPAVIIGTLSIAGIATSHGILRKRNIALAAAYTALDGGFKEYRERLIERFGKELDRELRYNIQAEEVEKTVTDENGEEKTVTEIVPVAKPTGHSIYARFYDDGCLGWEKDSEKNLMTLTNMERWANECLKSYGYLFLNDVYKMLGIPCTRAGNVVGWIYDKSKGDGHVSFGIHDGSDERKRAFVNGYERVILLDFNVDGPILNDVKLADH